MLRFLLAAAALCAASPLSAAEPSLLDRVHVEGTFQRQREHAPRLEAQGFGLGGSLGLGNYATVGVFASTLRTEPFVRDDLTGRLEYRAYGVDVSGYEPLTERSGLTASLGYVAASTRGLDGFRDDPRERRDGLVGSIGVSLGVLPHVDLNLGTGHSYVGNDFGWDVSGGLTLNVAHRAWVDLGYWAAEGVDGVAMTVGGALGGH